MQAEFEIQRATTSITTPDDDQFQRWIHAVPDAGDSELSLTIRIVDFPPPLVADDFIAIVKAI